MYSLVVCNNFMTVTIDNYYLIKSFFTKSTGPIMLTKTNTECKFL